MTDDTDLIERLEAAARERWGDAWTLEISRFTDGTQSAFAVHYRGRTDEDLLEKERLFVDDDGNIVGDRIVVDPETVVDSEPLGTRNTSN